MARAGLQEAAGLQVDLYRPKAKLQESASIRSAEIAGPDLPEVGLHSDIYVGQPIQGPLRPERQEALAQLPGLAKV